MNPPLAPSELAQRCVSQRFVERIPIHFARRHVLIGLADEDPQRVEVVTDDEHRRPTVENLALALDCEVRLRLCQADAILECIDRAYQQQRPDVERFVHTLGGAAVIELEDNRTEGDLLDNAARAPVIKLVNMLLFEAAQRRASDVHIQPCEDSLSVRLRIDGLLVDYLSPPPVLHDEIVSRIKVIGGMDIAERRLPQDGRTTVRIGSRLIDLRVSIIPTAAGERVVLRLLDKSARLYDLAQLGMAVDVRAHFEQLIQRSHGLILLTGPTGSGKTTTLYAALQRIDVRRLNVVTLEDPIEYHLPGISQTQVAQRKGMTFATGLRSVLRQDPDVIMVGEIRDAETARLAIQAALTGHLVLSTLHTNDAAGAIARLLDLGIEPYLVADALLAVGAQRLVRRICAHCRVQTPWDPAVATQLGRALQNGDAHQWGRGCDRCAGSGYYERVAIGELLVVDELLRTRIHARSAANSLRAAARRGGMRSLRGDGLRLVDAGLTTPAEVLRVTPGDAPATEE